MENDSEPLNKVVTDVVKFGSEDIFDSYNLVII